MTKLYHFRCIGKKKNSPKLLILNQLIPICQIADAFIGYNLSLQGFFYSQNKAMDIGAGGVP